MGKIGGPYLEPAALASGCTEVLFPAHMQMLSVVLFGASVALVV